MTMQDALDLWHKKAEGSSCNYGFHMAISEWDGERAAEVEYTYEVTAPYAAVLTKIPEEGTSKQGWREQIGLFICPITPDTSRVWFRLAVADFET